MKSNYTITCYADLEREEIRVKKRLKKQEELLRVKLKTLPEELVIKGATKIITGVVTGNLLQTAMPIIELLKGLFKSKKEAKPKEEEEEPDSKNGIMDLLKTVLKNRFSK